MGFYICTCSACSVRPWLSLYLHTSFIPSSASLAFLLSLSTKSNLFPAISLQQKLLIHRSVCCFFYLTSALWLAKLAEPSERGEMFAQQGYIILQLYEAPSLPIQDYSQAIFPFSVSPVGCFPTDLKKCTGLFHPMRPYHFSRSHRREIQ